MTLLLLAVAAIVNSISAAPVPEPCQVPRNCGDHNNSVVCGHKFTGCEFTCDFCCSPPGLGNCDGCTAAKCKVVPPLPLPIPACNATNYHEFWCTVTNETESFQALATRLHVSPTKLCEYNFQYDCILVAGVVPNNSIRVPFDQCTPKPGVWNCYEVTAGDTLLSVAAGPQSVVLDALKLKNMNLDIVYGDSKLYPGQHLRLPILHCFGDATHDCHTVASTTDSLQSLAVIFNTTAKAICNDNFELLADRYCDPGLQPLPTLRVGMELLVPRLHLTPPSPCKEIPGYWTCCSIVSNDSIWDSVAPKLKTSPNDLIALNFDAEEKFEWCPPGSCSSATACPHDLTDKERGPECLRIGQVLTARVAMPCTPKPGSHGCITVPPPDNHGNQCIGQLLAKAGSPFDQYIPAGKNFFCAVSPELSLFIVYTNQKRVCS
jgi:hypothetical protein